MSTTNQSITATVATYDAVRASIATRSPLHIIYATGGVEAKERTIRPQAILIGQRGSDLILCNDNSHADVITLRIDRVIALSVPVEARR